MAVGEVDSEPRLLDVAHLAAPVLELLHRERRARLVRVEQLKLRLARSRAVRGRVIHLIYPRRCHSRHCHDRCLRAGGRDQYAMRDARHHRGRI